LGLIDNRIGLWMLPAHVGTSRSTLATLQRDFARLRTLDHPHIARVHELGCKGQQYYVTGERIDGEPLREVLTHLLPERLDVGEADDVVRAIGSALVYAHEQGVVHGDVRAENVLVAMDRRFLLTNFLARRVAKSATRPPRPHDDLTALARLAAELYTGTSSVQALRAAAHRGVPAARLNAIRAVLESPPNRRNGSVADFLANAGLAFPKAAVQRPARPTRAWSLWHFVVPVAAALVVGIAIANYQAAGSEWRESAADLQRRGLDALRTVATRATVTSPVQKPAAVERASTAAPPAAPAETPAAAPSAAPEGIAAAPSAPEAETVVEPNTESVPATQPAAAPTPAREQAAPPATTARVRRGDPAVLSLGLPRVAAREDHLVVAIDVVRSGDLSRETDVGWWTTPDTAHEGEDYAGGRRMVTFPAGASVERLLIPIVNDGVRESDEALTVHLSRPRNAVTGNVTATRVTLHDDD
jgi:hypothetical protein